jgi:hypothetical protein
MKQFTVAQYMEAKVAGKELGINFVGKKKEDFINQVNQALAAQTKPEKVPAKSLADYNLTEGQVVTIAGRVDMAKVILADRQVVITKATKHGYVKGQLIGKEGKVQKTEISIPVSIIITNQVAA